MLWPETNPNPHAADDFFAAVKWETHLWGRQQYFSNYARGGFASVAFAPTAWEAFKAPWRHPLKAGSTQHLDNLRRIQRAHPDDPRIGKVIRDLETKSTGTTFRQGMRDLGEFIKTGPKTWEDTARITGKVGGAALKPLFSKPAMYGSMVGLPMLLTPGGPYEKLKAGAGGLVGQAGWEVGGKLGMGIGAAIGTLIPIPGATAVLAALGYVVGGLIGFSALDMATQGTIGIADKMVERERERRQFGWVNTTAAFDTQKAHTMRQQSLQLMSRGLMTTRSLMGREAVVLHQ